LYVWKGVIKVSPNLRVVHYLNQFFGGIGGEEKASECPQVKDGVVGIGRAMQDALKERGQIVATVICGDNYFAEKTEEAIKEVMQMMAAYKPDLVLAGPAFNAGRYGVACGEVCKVVQEKLGIPAVTGMYEENPGVDLYQKDVYIVKTVESAKGTAEVALSMVDTALKLIAKERLGKPAEEGYFPRGVIVDERSDWNAAERAVSMLLTKIKGEPFESEMETPKFDKIRPPDAIKDLASAKIALVTDGGLVPKGNPDNMVSLKSTRFATYNINGLDSIRSGEYEANHVGYDTNYVDEDPHRLVPLDIMRDLEREGVIGELHDKVYSTAGVATSLTNAQKIGRGIAEELKAGKVDGVILTST
jgi:betaine reductase